MTKTSCLRLLLTSFVLASGSVVADVAIIVNPANSAAISTEDIKSLFSGRQKSFSNDKAALLLSLEEGNPIRSSFNSNVLGKSDAQMKA
ncbi:hypothetical protein [Rheinheimera gaetbuli]